mmetsp:Transcript_3479/g.3673  ORF Transcript_3479/g.3673 Transcript_3479/m.3673 type:complete len:80 (+) Transcript_3479:245-484(+)
MSYSTSRTTISVLQTIRCERKKHNFLIGVQKRCHSLSLPLKPSLFYAHSLKVVCFFIVTIDVHHNEDTCVYTGRTPLPF